MFLVHTPLVAFISGLYLFRRLHRIARENDVVVYKSLCVGILIGIGCALAFYAFGLEDVVIF